MNDPLLGYSIEEINSNREFLKIVLINCSTNVKSYAKWFEISEVNKNEESYTSYKIIYRLLPKDLNESIKELCVWKRFRDFKELYQIMSNYHISLHRKDKFPDFPKPKFFGRFDEKVIEERKECSLRLLQFIGSQSHLYRHEKFIEFLADGTFVDYAQKSSEAKILRPVKAEKTKAEEEDQLKKKLQELSLQLENYINTNQMNNLVVDYLANTKKLLSLCLENKNNYLKLLNTGLENLEDCIQEMENNPKIKTKMNFDFIKSLFKNLSTIQFNLSKLLNEKEEIKKRSETESSIEATYLNDWILSEFNLKSNDFNNELSLISGKLLDLSFNFKPVKLLNSNCILVKDRNDLLNQKLFVLKRLQKSFNPILTLKSIVPFANRVPYMCQLLKYYESDDSIFLLIEFYSFGKLFQYLPVLEKEPKMFLKNLNIKKLSKQESVDLDKRRNSISELPANWNPGRKRRTQSEVNEVQYKLNSQNEINIDVDLKCLEYKEDNCLSSSSVYSSSSVDSITESELKNKVEFLNLNESKSDKQKWSLNLFKLSKKTNEPVAKFKRDEEDFLNKKKESDSSRECDEENEDKNDKKYLILKQKKLWLAQLVCVLKHLHEINLICKDLNTENLLIDKNGFCVLTYFSKWNLVDEKLSLNAVENFYVAPELCGMVNYEVNEACDWWSFGIIAYEILTSKKFSDMHSINQVYVNNIIFPEEFVNVRAKNLIKKLLRINPNERLKEEQIKSHSYFSNIDWINLENLFWKSK